MNLGEMIGWGESPWGPLVLGIITGMMIGPTVRQSLQSQSRSPGYEQTAAARESARAELDSLAAEATIH